MKYLLIPLIAIPVLAISWAATVGIIWLIGLCFGWTFDWFVATGVWLVMLLVGNIFRK